MCGLSEERLYTSMEVPPDFWEIGITGGYRHPESSVKQCLLSLFTWHNETLNIWTHLISTVFYVWLTVDIAQRVDLLAKENLPLFCLLVTSCLFPFGSAMAHLFNNLSCVARHVCFMLDYLCITLYAFGSCLANKAYAIPVAWKNGNFEEFYLSFMFVNCVLALVTSCTTRFMPMTSQTKVLRLSAFAFPYLCGMLPCAYRVFTDSDSGTDWYKQHFLDTIFTVSFYGGHLPERWFPGRFNIFFHSHQLFHVIVVIGTYHHALGIIADLKTRPSFHNNPSINPLYSMIALTVIQVATIFHFGRKMMHRKQHSHKMN